MEFKIGDVLIIKKEKFMVQATKEDYAIVTTFGEKIVDGGYMPIVIKKADNQQGFQICTQKDDIRKALKLIFVEGLKK